MDALAMQRRLRLNNAVQQSAYTLALAKNQKNPDIKASMDRLDKLEESIRQQAAVTQKLQKELAAETEQLKALVEPFAKKELEGIEDAG